MNTVAKLRRQLNETNCTLALLYLSRALSVLHFELLTSRIESIVQLQQSSFANDLFPIFALSLCFPVHPLLMESGKRSLLATEDRKTAAVERQTRYLLCRNLTGTLFSVHSRTFKDYNRMKRSFHKMVSQFFFIYQFTTILSKSTLL